MTAIDHDSQHLPDWAPRFDTPLVRPFWEALARGELNLPACSICGAWQWYPYEFVKCHDEATHVWKTVPSTGTVFTFTRVHRGLLPNAQKGAPPYVSALVSPDGIPEVRIACVLIGLENTPPAIGMRVRLKPVERSGYSLPAFEPLT